MKSDANEGIQNIVYDTFLKQPTEVQLFDGRKIKNYYDGGGTLLKTVYYSAQNTVIETWEFRQGMIFKNGLPYQLTTPEGRAVFNPSDSTWHYEFDYKDHLGNTRVSFRDSSGVLVKTAETAFDPYGVKLPIGVNNATQNRWEMQGKEKESTFNLNRINFGNRTLNPTTGVWDRVDEMSEKNHFESGYVYLHNSPLKYIDPDGKDAILVIKGNNITINSNIYIYGSGATKSTASQMQSDIMSKWDKGFSIQDSKGSSFNVKFNVKVGLYGNKEKNKPLIIPESWNPNNRDNFIEVGASLNEIERSFVIGGDEGEWRGVGRNGMSLSEDSSPS